MKKTLMGGRETAPCVWCGTPLTLQTATKEHLWPKSHGGSNHISNLALACKSCNEERGMVTDRFAARNTALELFKKTGKQKIANRFLKKAKAIEATIDKWNLLHAQAGLGLQIDKTALFAPFKQAKPIVPVPMRVLPLPPKPPLFVSILVSIITWLVRLKLWATFSIMKETVQGRNYKMCNLPQNMIDKLEKTVKQFLDEGRMFTGYDVTVETRQREQIHLRHNDVKAAIHELPLLNDAVEFGHDMPNGGTVNWGKAQVSMPGGLWAFVYHPGNVDPKGYRPKSTISAAPVNTSVSPAAMPAVATISVTPSDSGGIQPDGSFETDYRDRLLVPTRFLKEAGINAGDTVYVLADGTVPSILLVKDSQQLNGMQITTQVVERNGDVRLSSRTLKAASLTDSKFNIESVKMGAATVVQVKAP